jgi:hypothetical protein
MGATMDSCRQAASALYMHVIDMIFVVETAFTHWTDAQARFFQTQLM